MMKKILLLAFLLLLFTPYSAFAQNGLVPCGPHLDPPDDACQLCHLFVLINNLLKLFISTLLPIVAGLMLVIGGIWFYFAGASPEAKRKAQAIVTSSVIGIVIILAGWVVINSIFNYAGLVEMEGESWEWYKISCPIPCSPKCKPLLPGESCPAGEKEVICNGERHCCPE